MTKWERDEIAPPPLLMAEVDECETAHSTAIDPTDPLGSLRDNPEISNLLGVPKRPLSTIRTHRGMSAHLGVAVLVPGH
jgi:hypothetical protein